MLAFAAVVWVALANAQSWSGVQQADAFMAVIVCLGILVCALAALSISLRGARSALGQARAELLERSGTIQSQAGTLQAVAQDLDSARLECTQQAARLAAILDSVEQGVVLVAADRTIEACNRRAIEMLELPPDIMQRNPSFDAVLAQQWRLEGFVFTPDDVERFMRPGGMLDQRHRWERRRPDGATLELCGTPLPDGGFLQTLTDTTRSKRAEDQAAFLDMHDALTGLLNRRACLDRMAQILARQTGDGRALALLHVDLDRFRTINERYGNEVGDTLLRLAARRMRAVVRPKDTLARLGGNGFAVLLDQDATLPATPDIAERLKRVVSEPYEIDGTILHIDASIGGAFSRAGTTTVDAMLQGAHAALRRAKTSGRGAICLNDESFAPGGQNRATLERDLPSALETGQFRLLYQPIVDVGTGRPVGCEALLRWHHPRAGVLAPELFIPIAAELDLLAPLSRLVLRLACQEAAIWATPVRVAVNLAPAQLMEPQFGREIEQALADSGLAPQRLELEITEGVPAAAIAQTGLVMKSLQRSGIRFVMDDFGTGGASLESFQTLPFQQIKIGQAFIARLFDDDRPGTVIPAILAMASAMDVDVVAEGVATQAQADELQRLGCRLLQGYVFAEPGSPEWVRQYLWRSSTPEADPDWCTSRGRSQRSG